MYRTIICFFLNKYHLQILFYPYSLISCSTIYIMYEVVLLGIKSIWFSELFSILILLSVTFSPNFTVTLILMAFVYHHQLSLHVSFNLWNLKDLTLSHLQSYFWLKSTYNNCINHFIPNFSLLHPNFGNSYILSLKFHHLAFVKLDTSFFL